MTATLTADGGQMDEQTALAETIHEMLGGDEEVNETVETEEVVADDEPTSNEVTTSDDENSPEPTSTDELEETPAEKSVPLKALQEERRKRQEYEARLAEIEMSRQQQPSKAEPPQQSLEDWFEADPQAATYAINQEIARLQVEDPYNPQTIAQIEYLRDKKIELAKTSESRSQARYQSLITEARQIVPDFDKKSDILTEYAITQLGFQREELARMTNPAIVGKSAALNFIKVVNAQYETANAAKTIHQKKANSVPTQVEKPGINTGSVAQNPSLSQIKQRAKQTGDFTEYLSAIGALPNF